MNGAESLVRTLVGGGVNVCFTNPGTSEMHFVAALDKVEGMRCVLALFEGVVTGAADGYWRMRDQPAATLMHLGPGLGNGLANLHNAKKAHSGIVNIVGEHATHHIQYDAPLTADIEGIARPVSHWVKTSNEARMVAADGAEAIRIASTPPGQVATLILPGDTAWNEGSGPVPVVALPQRVKISEDAVRQAAQVLRQGPGAMLLLSGDGVRERGLALAGAIAQKTGARLMAQGSNARLQRGVGRVPVHRIPYPVPQALQVLKDVQRMILVGARAPVAFFGYPNQPSVLTPAGCALSTLATVDADILDALERLADMLGANVKDALVQQPMTPALPTGALDPDKIAAILGNIIPEHAIVVDESVTTGRGFYPLTAGAPPHDWLQNMGGSIGYGMPVAVGAALACPDRKVLALIGDGSGMYTVQALWTMAREGLNITTVIWANRTYQILKGEFDNVGAGRPGQKAKDMLEIGRPDLDWVSMATGMGVPATRVTDCESLHRQLQRGLAEPGPYLIEAVL
ncbi:MAG: acetolactate synthase large subunit [Candidatus Tectomicrobia bacterium]|uniref:Acetolactate synthase large subunit n=1 Tax=Tectimicrobiota bacterium TaxID=2528274 RepID=A0A937W3T9_UNCTE|nr:acetolactate synthase large subunit [Candidatus Tectomicrobia bacterium]